MASILTEAVDDVRPFVDLRRQNLVVDVPADLGHLDVEAPHIRDSVNHVLLNAVKFTPDGGTITLSGRRTPEGGVKIRVSDTGAGMDPAHMRSSCSSRSSPATTSPATVPARSSTGRKGLGLGLSLVKAFIEMHGGTVTCESEPGKGTTFTLELPPHPAEPPEPAVAGATAGGATAAAAPAS